MKRARVKVDVQPGFFSSERTVTLRLADRSYVLFVDQEDLDDGGLEVYVLREEEDRALIQLPQEAMEGGSRVFVPRRDLIPLSAWAPA